MTIREHDVVVLTCDLPEYSLRAGDVGSVVHVYADRKGYEVEFVTGAGQTLAVETLEAHAIRPLGNLDILHIRNIEAA